MSYKGKGVFIPTTFTLEPLDISGIELTTDKLKDILVRLYQNLNDIAIAVNLKDTGVYDTEEYISGRSFFPNTSLRSTSGSTAIPRSVYRKVINFGSLPNTTSKSVAHNLTITSSYTFTNIYGVASDVSGNSYIPLPYASTTLSNNIELKVDSSNVIITTGVDRTSFTYTYVVLEYITT